jgi:hypothetical protein
MPIRVLMKHAERTLSMNGKEDAAILLYSNLKNPYLP